MSTKLATTKVPQMLEMVEQRLREIKEISNVQYKTHGQFKYNPGMHSATLNIQQERSLERLLQIGGFLVAKKKNYDEAADLFGLQNYPPAKWEGCNIEDWLHDVKLRCALVQSVNRKEELMVAKRQLEEHLSQDQKLEKVLHSISENFGLKD